MCDDGNFPASFHSCSLQAIQRLREQLPDKNLSLEFAKLDLASLSQVQEFAKNFLANHDYLHLLINNAGVAMPSIGRFSQEYLSLVKSEFSLQALQQSLSKPMSSIVDIHLKA